MSVRRTLISLLAAVIALPALLFGASPAHADMYSYWSLWTAQDGKWAFSETGAGDVVPANGDTNGWRWGVGGVDASSVRAPRELPPFADVCGTDPAPAGQKKVAEVIDTGTVEDAPNGSTPPAPRLVCATVPENATALQALQSVGQTRVEGGIVCAIDGFPATGCGEVIAGATAMPSDTPTTFATAAAEGSDSSGPNVPTILIGITGIAAVIAVVAVLVAKQRRGDGPTQ
jgi:hypothetical protein